MTNRSLCDSVASDSVAAGAAGAAAVTLSEGALSRAFERLDISAARTSASHCDREPSRAGEQAFPDNFRAADS